ncbi:SIS domain-containing protein [Rhizobium sp. G21]|uniref:SIS domain-containing protein n=1 Tax=Rhizobium sp. G21 TaxID=2758439 RepID=UPI001602B19E|nr:SIS domain-containing protein [Rhizobium sp. G21]MBB1248856.1 SIS domain-containing protein [Rhizobium sp. G21]
MSRTPRTVERDVQDQPQALSIVLDRMFGEGRMALDGARATVLSGRPVIVTGMGASFHVAVPLVYHLSAMGVNANLIETGELVRHRLLLCRNAVVVVISQSGQTNETVELLDAMTELNAITIGVTNEEPGALARRAHLPLIVGSPRDTVFAVQTYMGAMAVLLSLSGRPGLLERRFRAGVAGGAGAGVRADGRRFPQGRWSALCARTRPLGRLRPRCGALVS